MKVIGHLVHEEGERQGFYAMISSQASLWLAHHRPSGLQALEKKFGVKRGQWYIKVEK